MTVLLLIVLLASLLRLRAYQKEFKFAEERRADAWQQVEERNLRILRLENQHKKAVEACFNDAAVIAALRAELEAQAPADAGMIVD